MEIVFKQGDPSLAQVYVARTASRPDALLEFVDACDPAVGDRRRKWVIVVSSQYGCPVRCAMCDAGGDYTGNVSAGDIRRQIEAVFGAHPGLDPASCDKLKVQFARMGEPSLNPDALLALQWLAGEYPSAIPCLATIAPRDGRQWFERLLGMRDRFRDFQLQFSINTTDLELRNRLMPCPKLDWDWMAGYGAAFHRDGQRKAGLNFALTPSWPVDAAAVRRHFDPRCFVVKLTPLNPTEAGAANGFPCCTNIGTAEAMIQSKAREFEGLGFGVIRSVGDLRENDIGSNCGQAVRRFLNAKSPA